jgi:hypothetical protein
LLTLHFRCVKIISYFFFDVIQVDILGDEVDTLLSVLGKIYIALDHYSPVLKHYPGVRELLLQFFRLYMLCTCNLFGVKVLRFIIIFHNPFR